MSFAEKYGGDIRNLGIEGQEQKFELKDGRVMLEVEPDSEAVANKIANDLYSKIEQANADPSKEHFVVVLPTGNTPVKMYEKFSELAKEGQLDLSKVIVTRVEGFVGLDRSHPKSFDKYVVERFFNANGVAPTKENFLSIEDFIENPGDLSQDELQVKAKDYDKKIQDLGGIDYSVLGLGGDAHVGDVQPSDMDSMKKMLKVRSTRVMEIPNDFDPYTRDVFESDYKEKGEEYPSKYFITLGMTPLSRARETVVMATGHSKSPAIKKGVSDVLQRWNNDTLPEDELTSPFAFLLSTSSSKPERSTRIVADRAAYDDLFKEVINE